MDEDPAGSSATGIGVISCTVYADFTVNPILHTSVTVKLQKRQSLYNILFLILHPNEKT